MNKLYNLEHTRDYWLWNQANSVCSQWWLLEGDDLLDRFGGRCAYFTLEKNFVLLLEGGQRINWLLTIG